MKYILVLLIISTSALAETKTKNLPKAEVKPRTFSKPAQPSAKAQEVLKEKEDCDTKAKKEVKVEPETFSLGGNTGCSLDEI